MHVPMGMGIQSVFKLSTPLSHAFVIHPIHPFFRASWRLVNLSTCHFAGPDAGWQSAVVAQVEDFTDELP